MKTTLIVTTLTLGLGLTGTASAIDMNQAMERAQTIKKYQDTLKTADKTTQAVLVDEGLKSADQQIAHIAADFAFASQDKDIQDIGVRNWWGHRTNFVARLVAPDKPTPAQKAFLAQHDVVPFSTLAVTDKGELTAANYYVGNFTRGGFELMTGRGGCRLLITEVTAKFLAGTFGCVNLDPIAVRIQVE